MKFAEDVSVYTHILAEVCFASSIWIIILSVTRKMNIPKMNALGYGVVLLLRKIFDFHTKSLPPVTCLVTSVLLLISCILLDKTVSY